MGYIACVCLIQLIVFGWFVLVGFLGGNIFPNSFKIFSFMDLLKKSEFS